MKGGINTALVQKSLAKAADVSLRKVVLLESSSHRQGIRTNALPEQAEQKVEVTAGFNKKQSRMGIEMDLTLTAEYAEGEKPAIMVHAKYGIEFQVGKGK